MMTGIPVNRIAQTESNKLAILPELIESKVIGQRSCFKNCAIDSEKSCPNRPIGSFILGQTGVGKTQLAKVR
jgi:ATP-dependent Clp protease ATP-binding subunit ClpC